MDGILNIYKEAGWTSHDVVAKLRGILKTRKIGHTGTLDPDAVGVLPVCIGRATKACDMLTDKSKVYEAVLRLGITTDTEDMSGRIRSENVVNATCDEVKDAVLSFLGEYEQIPPMYSAIKVNGQKLYEIAREGKVIERTPRLVTIYDLEILEMNLPTVRIRISCSKGTYIRSLCRDIGEKLGCGGCMEHLTRTKVGEFTIEKSIPLSKVQELADNNQIDKFIKPVDHLFLQYPMVKTTTMADHKLAGNGNPLSLKNLKIDACYRVEGQWIRLYDIEDRFIGIYKYSNEKKRISPVKMFLG